MLRLHFSVELHYDIAPPGADFIFNFHAARTRQQKVIHERLQLTPTTPSGVDVDPFSRNRCLRLKAGAGHLKVFYEATVDLDHYSAAPESVGEIPIGDLPGAVLPYLYPSRYCQSDRLQRLAFREFAHLPQGYSRAQAICDWVGLHVSFVSNSSDASTSALDTVIDGVGVCRDFAHVMVALCRAVNLPARFATGIDYGADPALGPADFHAYVEVYLGHRWYLFDPSGTAIPMGLVRFATGLDAADSAFATLFGAVTTSAPIIHIQAVPNGEGQLVIPQRGSQALSTDGPPDPLFSSVSSAPSCADA